MSNVLIGIIGVVLFIGLALAGALLLGSDFMTATSASKAAAISQGLQQSQAAYAMNTLKTGSTITADQGNSLIQTLITNRRLKSAPINPIAGGGAAFGVDNNGQQNAAKPMGAVAMVLGPYSTKGLRDTCYAIEEQMGSSNPAAVDTPTDLGTKMAADARVGCFNNSYSNGYVAYAPL